MEVQIVNRTGLGSGRVQGKPQAQGPAANEDFDVRSAVVLSTTRSAIGKAYRGAFNNNRAQALGGMPSPRR